MELSNLAQDARGLALAFTSDYEGLEIHDVLEKLVSLSNLSGDFGVRVLAESYGRVVSFLHLGENLLSEDFRLDKRCRVALQVALIKSILVVELISRWRSPSLDSDKVIIENLRSVDFNQASILVISDSSSIVALSEQVLAGSPGDGLGGLKVRILNTILGVLSHVDGQQVFTDSVV